MAGIWSKTLHFDAQVVYRRVTNTIQLYAKQRRLVQMVSDQIRAREKNTSMLVGVLSQIVEFRNGECGAFNPLLIRCLADTAEELKSELQNDFH